MKNLGILISWNFFLAQIFLRKVRQSVSSSISHFLIIINFEVVLQEFLGSADLTRIPAFCIHKLSEVIIINKNAKLKFGAFQMIAPSVKNFNDNQELLIALFAPRLCKNYFLRKKCY